MKTCSCCKIEKPFGDYGNNKSRKDGLQTYCRDCFNIKAKENRIKKLKADPDCYKKQYKNRLDKNPNYLKNEYKRRKNNGEDMGKRLKIFIKNNPNYNKKGNNGYRSYEDRKETLNNYYSNPLNKLKRLLRSSIRKGLNGERKYLKTQEIVGCSWEQLKQHLESQFQPNMTWDNHGQYGWHIDHIIPLASATTEEQIYKLNHYTNLQPLWWEDNIKKGDKLVWNK